MIASAKARNVDEFDAVRAQWNRLSHGCESEDRAGEGFDFCRRQFKVILLLSASRSGASWLAELCASSSRLLSLPGEIDPFLLLALGPPDVARGESDRLDATHASPAVGAMLSRYLSHYAGNQARAEDHRLTPRRRFQIAMRSLLQWPELHDRMADVYAAIGAAFESSDGGTREARMIVYLARLKALLPRLNPYFYDVDPELIHGCFPAERIPAGPPRETCVIEEPPFVCESPWACALDGAELDRPLLLKSPSNAYRLDFLRALFPNAEITVLHLIRDPVASVTGLMSGWLHHGFFKHRMPAGTLGIERYTRPDQPWTGAWWKFDLPPGWRQYVRRPLEEVCGFQWTSANEHILRWVERNRSDIQYVQTSTQRLTADLNGEVARLFSALDLQPDAGLLDALALNRRTMVSYGVSDNSRARLRRLAADVTDSAQVRNLLDALADAGNGPAFEIAQAERSL
jgi:Sulfotransferase family